MGSNPIEDTRRTTLEQLNTIIAGIFMFLIVFGSFFSAAFAFDDNKEKVGTISGFIFGVSLCVSMYWVLAVNGVV
jgi:hypothetical protein